MEDFGGTVGQQIGAGTGSVTSASVVTANGFSGTVANPTTTPAITLDTTGEKLLVTSSAVDVNTATPTSLFTCPALKTCLITRVALSNPSTSLTTASLSFGWNSASYNNVIANATHVELTGSTLFTILLPKVGATLGAAADVLKVLANTLQGGAATVDIRVFGILF